MKNRGRGQVIFFATGNIHKFNEACKVLAEYKIAVEMLRTKALEIQSDSLEKIAKTSVLDAFSRCNLPIIVEDAGLFIDALNGFPGPYTAYAYRTINNGGILKLMKNIENRKATFHSVIAHCSSESKSPISFKGEAAGEITKEKTPRKHQSSFGFDPIFKPANSSKTFAEMNIMEKNKYSHRAQALREFAEWYKKAFEDN
jgi:XTP/dITP diphosphohydrolase